jgi:hypothetical protein
MEAIRTMSTPITIQIPEEAIVEALRQLSPQRRRDILQQVSEEQEVKLVTFPVESLYKLTGIVEIGGDALTESDQIYDE